MAINLTTLRGLPYPQLAQHFRQLVDKHSDHKVSAQLLAEIEEGSVPATVIPVWLSVSKTPLAVADALLQSRSILARRSAIARFGKTLRRPEWRDVWDHLGGIAGLLAVFAELSVQDVKLLAKAIGRCNKGPKDEGKQREVTELLRGLLGSLYPDAPYKTRDERPLQSHYASIVPACDPKFVGELVREASSPLLGQFSIDRLLQVHYGVVGEVVLDAIFKGHNDSHILHGYLPSLLLRMPPIPSERPGWSASMHFSLTLLRKLSAQEDSHFPSERFLPELITPLMQRAVRKKLVLADLHEIAELAITYLEKNSAAAAYLSTSRRGFIYYLARCWSWNPELFEDLFTTALRLFPHGNEVNIEQFQEIIRSVPRTKRYALLQLLVVHTKRLGANISQDDDLRRLRVEKWPCDIFTDMMQNQAVSLLRALIRVKPEGCFLRLESGSTILSMRSLPTVDTDPALLLNLLQRGQTAALESAKKGRFLAFRSPPLKLTILLYEAVEEQKRKASTSRERTDRAFFARSALLWAIASGSLALYGEVVIWTRRFVRDPLTNRMLYASDVTKTVEGIALLCGMPFDMSQEWNSSKVRSRVVEANNVLLGFLETACQALREPSFQAYDWQAPLTLFRSVVEARLSEAPKIQKALKLSDEELYSMLWSETLNMLIQAEKIGLQPGHEALNFNSANGPLCYNNYAYEALERPHPSSYRFIDNLARARDQLWQEVRPTIHPSASILAPPWSRGLPVQCLQGPVDVASEFAQGATPFILARATDVVFLQPSVALSSISEDPEIRAAIGSFVDNYKIAVRIYVFGSPSKMDCNTRATHAWTHALRAWTGQQMTKDEGFRTWKPYFAQALPSFKPPSPDPEREAELYPVIPTDVDPQENTEWDPALHQPRKVDPQPLPVTYLDCILAAKTVGNFKVSTGFIVPKTHTQGFVPVEIWSLYRLGNLGKVPFAVKEGLVVSALLFLDAKKGGSSRILASPFPTELEIRYPPLFLDPEFLLRPELNERSALEVLESLISTVPPALLAKLAETTFAALSSLVDGNPELGSLERIAYGLLSLLLSSDRPQVAATLILRAIIERPGASSWHRAILNVGLARKLPAQDAQALLSSFATSVGSKLEEQAESAKSTAVESVPGDPSPPPKPIIKVTTVKYLAQILNNADFVAPSFTAEVLSKLLRGASHLDVRVAVVDSLLGMLSQCTEQHSTPLAQRLLSALETLIPLVSGVSERRQMREEDWMAAEKTGELPRVYDDGAIESLPPILEQLLQWHLQRSKWRREYVNRILLPIIERSRQSNARWIKIFLAKHQLSLDLPDLPVPPTKPLALSKLLSQWLTLVPASLLDLRQQFVLVNMAPSQEIASINEKIRNDGGLRASNEGRHWLSLYGNGLSACNHGGFSLAKKLCREWTPSDMSDGIEIPQVQRAVLEQAQSLLKTSDHSFSEWNTFVRDLEPPLTTYHRTEDKEAWLANAKPVLEHIIAGIDSLRTPAWQRNPRREPTVLPLTFPLRLCLLSYPSLPSSSAMATATATEKCHLFADELSALVDEILACGPTYHADLTHLLTAASKAQSEYKASTACALGRLLPPPPDASSAVSAATLLQIELAETLFKGAKLLPRDSSSAAAAADRKATRDVLASWRASECEEIRMRGLSVTRQLQQEAPGERGWDLL